MLTSQAGSLLSDMMTWRHIFSVALNLDFWPKNQIFSVALNLDFWPKNQITELVDS